MTGWMDGWITTCQGENAVPSCARRWQDIGVTMYLPAVVLSTLRPDKSMYDRDK